MTLSDADSLSGPPQPSRWPLVLGLAGAAMAASFGALTWFQEPLFHRALERGDVRQVELWLRFNRKLADAPDAHGRFPLWKALDHRTKRDELGALLLDAGADPNRSDGGVTPLEAAIWGESIPLVKLILQKDIEKSFSFTYLAGLPLDEIVNDNFYECFNGNQEIRNGIFIYQINKVKDKNLLDKCLRLSYAFSAHARHWIDLLLKAGADPNLRGAVDAMYAISLDIASGDAQRDPKARAIFHLLVAAGFDFDAMAALEGPYAEAVDRLREAGLGPILDARGHKTFAPAGAPPSAEAR
jgi:ankyrin repeat protein